MIKKIIFLIPLFIIITLTSLFIYTRNLPPSEVLSYLGHKESSFAPLHQAEHKFLPAEIQPYTKYLSEEALEPVTYVINKFQNRDLVIIAENHWQLGHTDFFKQLIAPAVKTGLRDFAFETSNVQCQTKIEVFLEKKEVDRDLLYQVLSEEFDIFGWPFKGYVTIFLELHKINQNLKKQGDFLRIHLVDAPLRVEHERKGWFRDRHMAESIGKLLMQNRKVLFLCGATHALTGLVSQKSGKKFPTVGSLLYKKFAERIFSVKLHSFTQNMNSELFPIAGGLFDAVFTKYGKPIGFDLKHGPFQKISSKKIEGSLFPLSSDSNTLTDGWQGYVYLESPYLRKFCGIEEEMFLQGYIYQKFMRDSWLLGSFVRLAFGPHQLAGACHLYKLRNLGITS